MTSVAVERDVAAVCRYAPWRVAPEGGVAVFTRHDVPQLGAAYGLLRFLARTFAATPELGLQSQRFAGVLRACLFRLLEAI